MRRGQAVRPGASLLDGLHPALSCATTVAVVYGVAGACVVEHRCCCCCGFFFLSLFFSVEKVYELFVLSSLKDHF